VDTLHSALRNLEVVVYNEDAAELKAQGGPEDPLEGEPAAEDGAAALLARPNIKHMDPILKSSGMKDLVARQSRLVSHEQFPRTHVKCVHTRAHMLQQQPCIIHKNP